MTKNKAFDASLGAIGRALYASVGSLTRRETNGSEVLSSTRCWDFMALLKRVDVNQAPGLAK